MRGSWILPAAAIICAFAAGSWAQETQSGAALRTGQQTFASNCAGCHGLDGRGGEHAPNIATVPAVQQKSDGELARIVRDGIPAAGMPSFGGRFTPQQIKSIVGYLRILQGRNSAEPLPGNAQNGKTLFFGKAGCSDCHVVSGHGGFLGADLSYYGIGHDAGQIRKAIVSPDTVERQQPPATVTTRDGKRYSGIVRNQDNFSIQLQSTDGAFHSFDRSDVTVAFPSKSLMPADYGARLTSAELDDIVSYLASQR